MQIADHCPVNSLASPVGLVCEYVVNALNGIPTLMAPLRLEWASNGIGHGGGPYQSANLLLEPQEEIMLDQLLPAYPGEAVAEASEAAVAYGAGASSADSSGYDSAVVGTSQGGDGLPVPAVNITDGRGTTNSSSSSRWQEQQQGRSISPGFTGAVDGVRATRCCSADLGTLDRLQSPPRCLPHRPHSCIPGAYSNSSANTGYNSNSRSRSPARPAAGARAGYNATVPAVVSGAGTGGGLSRNPLAAFPGGPKSANVMSADLRNSWPSLEHQQVLGPSEGGAAASAAVAAKAYGGAGAVPRNLSPGNLRGKNGGNNSSSDGVVAGGTSEQKPAWNSGRSVNLSFGRSSTPGRGGQARSASPYGRVGCSGGGGDGGGGGLGGLPRHAVQALVRSSPVITQAMAKEVEALRDSLQFQHHLAEASATKVGGEGDAG